jgi:heme oxygenase
LTEAQRQAIVDEANLVFDLNIGILEELDGSPLFAMFSLAVNSLKEKLGFQ